MSDVVILVPRRADGGVRDDLWRFSRAWWADLFPDWLIVEGHHDEGPFNRSAAINRAADLAGPWDVAVIIDADVLPDQAAVHGAVAVARSGQPALGFSLRRHLTARGTREVMAGDRGDWSRHVKQDHKDSVSGAIVVGRGLWDQLGGFDEAFVGWGWEDVAFKLAAETLAERPVARLHGHLWHLWHPVTPERDEKRPEFIANRDRARRYRAARGNLAEMRALLAENERQTTRPEMIFDTTIPRILHRTVPAEPSTEAERWWEGAKALHPGWVHLNHQDPLDPADWPETGHLWERCGSGAQMAGLIRLEALWRWGGVYIDSDVELWRPLDPLLGAQAFAGWEDPRVVPDAVLGAAPAHPAVAIMLQRACASVEAGDGAWKSGPGVTTSTLVGRRDVLLLPPGSFYPIHYHDKATIGGADHAAEHPYAFGLHHWRHSWRGR